MFNHRSENEAIAEARGFSSAAEMRAFFKENGYPGEKRVGSAPEGRRSVEDAAHARDLEIFRKYQGAEPVNAPSARSEALGEELRTARTKAERDRAVDRFMASQKSPDEVRFAQWLQSPGHELRAAAESAPSAGGYLVPPGWYQQALHLAREYSGIMAGWDAFETTVGAATVQPSYSAYTATTNVSENAQVTDGPYSVIGQRSWPAAKVYSGSVTASFQLVQDYGADGTLATFVQRGLAEAVWRSLAADAVSTVYTAVAANSNKISLTAAKALTLDSGATTEFAANGLTIQTYAAMWQALDAQYKPSAVWRMNSTQANALSRIVDSQGRYQLDPSTGIASLFSRPIEVTNSISNLTASTASGPVLLSPQFAFTQRIVTGDAMFLASSETRAEFAEVYYRLAFRSSFMAADPAAFVGVVPAAN